MNLVYSCLISISMYSKIPMPQVEWKEERMRHVMGFFPAVGVLEGIALSAWLFFALEFVSLSFTATAFFGAALPVLITGGIHMDGFIDTMDAIHSYGDREKKLEILKDPHVGAFGIIFLAVYLLCYTGLLYEYVCLAGQGKSQLFYLFPACLMVTERAFSGLSVICFPKARKDGLAASFAETAKKQRNQQVLVAWLLAVLVVSGLSGGVMGAAVTALLIAAELFLFFWYYKMCIKNFGGVTGDLAGWFLQICELAGFAVFVLVLKVT